MKVGTVMLHKSQWRQNYSIENILLKISLLKCLSGFLLKGLYE